MSTFFYINRLANYPGRLRQRPGIEGICFRERGRRSTVAGTADQGILHSPLMCSSFLITVPAFTFSVRFRAEISRLPILPDGNFSGPGGNSAEILEKFPSAKFASGKFSLETGQNQCLAVAVLRSKKSHSRSRKFELFIES